MRKSYAFVAVLATSLALGACSVVVPDTDGGAGGTTTVDPADAGCSQDTDCPTKTCAAGICLDGGACVLSPLPSGSLCSVEGFVCGGLGQCMCLGCVDENGGCESGDSPSFCGVDGATCAACVKGCTSGTCDAQ